MDESEISGNDGNGNSSQDRDPGIAQPTTSTLEVGNISALPVAGSRLQVGDHAVHVTDVPSVVDHGEVTGNGGRSSCLRESAMGETGETNIVDGNRVVSLRLSPYVIPSDKELCQISVQVLFSWAVMSIS